MFASLAFAATNTISTVAGTGTAGYNGDGIAASSAQLSFPVGVTSTWNGGYYIADQVNHRVRRVDASGNISTVAGSGAPGFTGDNGPALSATFNAPSGVGILPDGSLLIADANNNRVRKVAPGTNGTITTDAGGGANNPGDAGPATSAQLAFPFDIAVIDQNTYLIADQDHHRIRRVASGTISTIAGDGTAGSSGDNGPSTTAKLNKPAGMAIATDGAVLIADTYNNRIRRVSATTGGTITTVAGTATQGYNGDGIPAGTAQLNHPTHVTALPDGGYLIADQGNNRLRQVSADGIISTVAGDGTAAYNGDGIPASTAQLNQPTGVAFTVDNDYLIADTFNHRIRRVDAGDLPPPPPTPPASAPISPPPAGSNSAATPQNVTRPTILGGRFAGFSCNPGTWRDLPSPPGFTYAWFVTKNGTSQQVASEQVYNPPTALYGYPIACSVSVPGPAGPVTAASDSVIVSSAGANHLPEAYGDVRVRGIDVFQVVQPTAGARQFAYPASYAFGGPGNPMCGGGTPTNWRRDLQSCLLFGRDPQRADYQGVTLDTDKLATAIVYTDVNNALPRDPNLTFDVELSATLNGTSLGEPLVLPATPLKPTTTPWVTLGERTGGYGVRFRLPSAWTRPGTLRLTAHVRFPDMGFGTSRFGTRQCDIPSQPAGGDPLRLGLPNCDANDTFTLDGVPIKSFPGPQFAILGLERQTATPPQANFTVPPAQLMKAATSLYPGGARMYFPNYYFHRDITDQSNVIVDPDDPSKCKGAGAVTGPFAAANRPTQRFCRWAAIEMVIRQWITDNPARYQAYGLQLYGYDGVLAVSDYDFADGQPEPGVQWPIGVNIDGVSATTPANVNDTGFMLVNSRVLPLTGRAHELGHWLTLPHAGLRGGRCGTTPLNEDWPPDYEGRLQGVMFNSNIFRGFRGLFIDDVNREIYDLMSYCANHQDTDTGRVSRRLVSPGNAWLSARNWNRVAAALEAYGARLGRNTVRAAPTARAAVSNGAAFAVGVADPQGGKITRVLAPDGQDGVPAPDANSPYRLRSLGASGQVLLEAGVTVKYPVDISPAVGSFVGPVAPDAVAVELLYNGRVLHRLDRTRPPRLTLTAPGRRTRVGRGARLVVRWRGSDPDGGQLEASVDFSVDGGRTWRSVYTGPDRGRAVVPASSVAGSRRARVRVSLNDGFAESTATSRPFVTAGNPPQVRIVTPDSSGTVRAGDRSRLSGVANDDLGRPLRGKALTWYAGGKRVGTGANLKARLPAGKVTLKLVARGSNGLTRTATVRLKVAPRRLRVVSVSVPQRVGRKARTVTVTLKTSARSRLTAAGRRFTVRTKATKLKIRLPKRPVVGVLKVPFKLSATDRSVKGTIKGSIWVVRT